MKTYAIFVLFLHIKIAREVMTSGKCLQIISNDTPLDNSSKKKKTLMEVDEITVDLRIL